MKFLYISDRYDDKPSGGRNVTRIHYQALCNIIAHNAGGGLISMLARSYIERSEPGKMSLRCSNNLFDSLVNRMSGMTSFNSPKAEKKILDMVKNEDYSFIWFDGSCFGSTIRKIKQVRPELPVFAFYHVVGDEESTASILKSVLKRQTGILQAWDNINNNGQERLTARYADRHIILSERDRASFVKRFGHEPDLTLPVCLADTAKINPAKRNSRDFNIMFIGIGYQPNNPDGIKWFAKNVMPHLNDNAVLYIVGNGMEAHRDAPEFKDNEKIKVLGRVEDLGECYNMMDLVVAPIFYGAGMMTKTVEAMMWGKNYLATSHALHGYEGLDDCRCDTAEEFITKINTIISSGKDERFNPAMRKIYEDKYSLSAMENMMREFLVKQKVIRDS